MACYSFGQYPLYSANNKIPIQVIGTTVTPHNYIDTVFYKASNIFDTEKGALVQIVVRNTGNESLNFRLQFDNKSVTDPGLVQSDGEPAYNKKSNVVNRENIPEWTWCEMPEQKAYKGKEYTLGAGKTDVFTYNSYGVKWGVDYSYTISVVDLKSETIDSFNIVNKTNEVDIEFISFLNDDKNSIFPDSAVVHLKNNSSNDFGIKKIRLYGPSYDLKNDFTNGLVLQKEIDQLNVFGTSRTLMANSWSGFTCSTGKLPLVRGLVEVILSNSGKEISFWAPLMFKKEEFNIGAGWLGQESESDSIFNSPLSSEAFLKTLKLMHIDVVHNNNVNRYIPGNLQRSYVLKHMLNEFAEVYDHPEIFNSEEYIRKSERIDCLGEPNWSRTAMESFLITKRYMLSETFPQEEWHIPTSIDHSMPQRIRYFAGLTDYPSFDNYRVTAPSDDRFRNYSPRWGGGKIAQKTSAWGSPLESVGSITRIVHLMNKPKPIAAWTQNIHHDWYIGKRFRERQSPTADEIYAQAYQILANGVTSLYWYSFEVNSILRFNDVINTTIKTGREIKMLEPLYLSGAHYNHERKFLNGNINTPDVDLNVLVTPKAAILFINDLTYKPDTNRKSASFKFNLRSIGRTFFPLPEYLQKPFKVVKVNADGIKEVDYSVANGGITIEKDSIFICGIYLVTQNESVINDIEKRRHSLINEEESLNFNPGSNQADFLQLKSELQAPKSQILSQ